MTAVRPADPPVGIPARRRGSVHAGARWSTIGKGGVQGIRFLVSLVIFHLLEPHETGLMNMALIVTGFLDQFKDFGTAQAVIQRKQLDEGFVGTVFVFNLLLGGMATLVLVAGAQPIAWLFAEPEVEGLLRAIGPVFSITCLGLVHRALLSRELRFERLARVDIAHAASYGIIAIVLASMGFGVWSLVYAVLGSSVVTVLLYWALSPWRPRIAFRKEHVAEVRAFCANLMGFNLLNYVLSNLDRILIGRILGKTALGFYGFAFYLTMFPVRSITSILISVLIPALARVQDDLPRLRSDYLRACAGIALVSFPMLAGIFVVADPLVRTFWPDKWEPAIVLVMLLTPVGIVHALSNTTGAIYLAKGRSDWMLRTTLLFGVLQVAALWIGSQWGTRGVAAAYALSSVVFAYLYFAIPFRLIGLRVGTLCRTLAPYAGMALVMAATAMGVRLALEHYGVHHSAVLAACVGTGVILYGLGVWLVRPTALQDLGAVMRRRG